MEGHLSQTKPFFIPPDNDELRERYKNSPKQGGTCGVAAIAALRGTTVEYVIERWVGKGEWPGYSPVKEMQATLEAMGYKTRKCRGGEAKQFPNVRSSAAIVRIQWLDQDGKPFPWFEAFRHTHYVLMRWVKGEGFYVFCNGTGWFPAHGSFAKEYLRPGYVSSYIEVSR